MTHLYSSLFGIFCEFLTFVLSGVKAFKEAVKTTRMFSSFGVNMATRNYDWYTRLKPTLTEGVPE